MKAKAIYWITADWCKPCKQLRPTYSRLAFETEGVTMGVIDIDDATEWKVMSVPSIVVVLDDASLVFPIRSAGDITRVFEEYAS